MMPIVEVCCRMLMQLATVRKAGDRMAKTAIRIASAA
jgi:hypothetical protein